MRVMVLVKSTPSAEAGEMPSQELIEAMTAYNEELMKAGIIQGGDGLRPSSAGVRIHFSGDQRTVVEGPFDQPNQLVAGFWIWEVKDMQEAIEWARRCPNPMEEDSDLEIRPFFEMEDFGDALTPDLRDREEKMRKTLAQQ
jgi:hypothetical protein